MPPQDPDTWQALWMMFALGFLINSMLIGIIARIAYERGKYNGTLYLNTPRG